LPRADQTRSNSATSDNSRHRVNVRAHLATTPLEGGGVNLPVIYSMATARVALYRPLPSCRRNRGHTARQAFSRNASGRERALVAPRAGEADQVLRVRHELLGGARSAQPPIADAERVAQSLRARPNRLPEGSAVAATVAECGLEDEAVTAACAARISTLATVLACRPSEVADMLVKQPKMHAVRDRHVARCLMTLQEILPGMDASKLVRNLTDLLVEDDAMERAQEAVCAIQRKGFDPISLVDSQPHVLLMHEHYFPSRDRLLKMLRRCG